jgi:hypothetical protein
VVNVVGVTAVTPSGFALQSFADYRKRIFVASPNTPAAATRLSITAANMAILNHLYTNYRGTRRHGSPVCDARKKQRQKGNAWQPYQSV